jgi:hypothetical protein
MWIYTSSYEYAFIAWCLISQAQGQIYLHSVISKKKTLLVYIVSIALTYTGLSPKNFHTCNEHLGVAKNLYIRLTKSKATKSYLLPIKSVHDSFPLHLTGKHLCLCRTNSIYFKRTIYLQCLWLYSPLLDLGCFFSFFIFTQYV